MSEFIVRVKLIVSEEKPYSLPGVESIPGFEKEWREGERINPNRKRRYSDSGFSINLLDETSNPEWVDDVVLSLEPVIGALSGLVDLSKLPTPLISIYVDTNGEKFPPLYFPRNFMNLVQTLKAEMDIDVIATLD